MQQARRPTGHRVRQLTTAPGSPTPPSGWLRYGVTCRGCLYWTIKTHHISLVNDQLGTELSQFGLGDPRFVQVRTVPFGRTGDLRHPVRGLQGAGGHRVAGELCRRPHHVQFVHHDDRDARRNSARAKRQVGPVAIQGGLAYVQRVSGVVQYVLETELTQFSGRIKPGNVTKADAGLLVGIGPVALDMGALLQVRDDTRIGATAAGLFPAKNLTVVEDSGGWALDATGGFTFNMTRGVDFVGSVAVPLGERTSCSSPSSTSTPRGATPTAGPSSSGTEPLAHPTRTRQNRQEMLMLRKISRLAAGTLALVGAALYAPAADAKFVFPYNHPDLDWHSIETEHFVVHYPVSKKSAEEGNDHALTGEWSARKIAQVSEDMWEPMCAEFNYYLKERVHIVLLNQGDELQGFTIPPWDWIEISANPGGTFLAPRAWNGSAT